jgi:hydroxyacylglutathione hydrolase
MNTVSPVDANRLYFRQILIGRDVATDNPFARQMVNYAYAIGDRATGVCVVVDPAYDVSGIINLVAADDMTVTGVLITHFHADHAGGTIFGHSIEGVSELLELSDVPVHVHREETTWVARSTGLAPSAFVEHDSGDFVRVGDVDVTLLHTPGHTPGSQCFLVDSALVAGDTLFLQGCGRTDFPGGNPSDMFRSLRHLAALPADTMLYPGHMYSPQGHDRLGAVIRSNPVLQVADESEWLTLFA